MRPLYIVLATYIFFCAGISGAQELTDTLPPDPSVRTGTLANGMKYYIRKNHKPENRGEFRLAVRTGSVMEDDDQQGLAHFCEHMEFNGTKHFPKLDLVNFLESTGVRFGAHVNAFTSFDETVYMLQLPLDKPEVVDKGLLVFEDWAGNATFEDTEIDKERGVVLEEWRLGRGANERVQNKHLPVELYHSHYADRIPIGKKEIIENCSHETLRKFYHDWYRPDLMAFVAVGDFDVDWMETQIKTRFNRLSNPPNERARIKYDVPLHDTTLISIAGDKELQYQMSSVLYERPKQKMRTVADFRKHLTSQLYDEMLDARMQELMRKGDPPFAFGFVNNGGFLGEIDVYQSTAILKPDGIEKGLTSQLEEMYRVRRNGFTQTELDRTKQKMLTEMDKKFKERDKTESDRIVWAYVSNFMEGDPYISIDYENELYKKYLNGIALDEVNALSAKLMDGKSRVITISAQLKDSTSVLPSEAEIRGIVNRVSTGAIAAYDDKVSNKPLLSKAPISGKIVGESMISDLGITKWNLSNGATVILKPTDFKNDEILFTASSPGGISLSSDADFISAQTADNIIEESGVGEFDQTTLTKMLAGKNVSLSPTLSNLQQGFRGNCSPKDAETMFQLVYLYGMSPRKDIDALHSFQARYSSILKNKSNDPMSVYYDTLQATMSQYHPRELPWTTETLNKVDLDKAFDFYKDRFSDFSGFTFYLVGNLDMKKIKPLVETYLASLPGKNKKETWRDIGVAPPKGKITKSVFKGIEPKSNVTINFTGPFTWNAKNRLAIELMANVLQIKLRETLREDMSGVYYVNVRATPKHYPKEEYQMSINFGCDPKRVDELIAETMKKVDTMIMKAPESIYLTKVKEIAKHEDEVNLKENRHWLSALSTLAFNGEEPHTIIQRKNLITAVTAEDIHQAAAQYCSRDNIVEVVLYPEKK